MADNAVEIVKRVELKYAAPVHEAYKINFWIKNHPANLMQKYPDRIVNNVYLDTVRFDSLFDNLSGISERKKYRLRWYGSSSSNGPLSFEIKSKHNSVSSKRTYKVGNCNLNNGFSWKNIVAEKLMLLPDEIAFSLKDNLYAVVANKYVRSYYESRCGSFRVTVDTAHRAYEQWTKMAPNFNMPSVVPDIAIIEVKYLLENERTGRSFAESIPYRFTRHSKYLVNAVNSLPS